MSLSAQEELKIFQNIIAQSPQGLGDPELIGKFAKVKATLHVMDSMGQVQSNNAPISAPQTLQGTPTGQPDQSTQEPLATANTGQDQPPMQNEGQGTMNLPQ
jgi:hypothetical protein